MLPDEELRELADDILANGQMLDIMLDRDGRLIDGRNRLKACGIAGVEPRFSTFDGDGDAAIAYIISTNVNRRHLSKGQRAMAVAMAYPVSHQGQRTSIKITEVSESYVQHARIVLLGDPEAAKSVMAGAIPLDQAYQATRQKVSVETDRRGMMGKLRARYADLAEQVEREELSLKAALVEADDRDERARNQRHTKFKAVREAVDALAVLAFEDDVAQVANAYPEEFRSAVPLGFDHLFSRAQHAAEGAQRLGAIIEALREGRT